LAKLLNGTSISTGSAALMRGSDICLFSGITASAATFFGLVSVPIFFINSTASLLGLSETGWVDSALSVGIKSTGVFSDGSIRVLKCRVKSDVALEELIEKGQSKSALNEAHINCALIASVVRFAVGSKIGLGTEEVVGSVLLCDNITSFASSSGVQLTASITVDQDLALGVNRVLDGTTRVLIFVTKVAPAAVTVYTVQEVCDETGKCFILDLRDATFTKELSKFVRCVFGFSTVDNQIIKLF